MHLQIPHSFAAEYLAYRHTHFAASPELAAMSPYPGAPPGSGSSLGVIRRGHIRCHGGIKQRVQRILPCRPHSLVQMW